MKNLLVTRLCCSPSGQVVRIEQRRSFKDSSSLSRHIASDIGYFQYLRGYRVSEVAHEESGTSIVSARLSKTLEDGNTLVRCYEAF